MSDTPISNEIRPYSFRTLPVKHYGRTVYAVIANGEEIGTVEKRIRESWRTWPSGVRYSKRGNIRDWVTQPKGEQFPSRVGYATRAAAAEELMRVVSPTTQPPSAESGMEE